MLCPMVDPVVGALVCAVLVAPLRDALTEVPNPVPCCALCSAVALRAVPLPGWEEFDPPRSACGAKPVLTVDDFSTIVLSGCDVAWEVAAEVTGVVVTGWPVTALPVVTAAGAFADVVTAFTGWFSAGENDADGPVDPLGERPEAPEEKAAAEYGADEPCCTDIE